MKEPRERGRTARNILIWTYERGTLQYDILCGLILAFIFFVPRSCFAPKKTVDHSQVSNSSSQRNPAVSPDVRRGN